MFVLAVIIVYLLLFKVLNLRPERGVASCGLYGFSGKHAVDKTKLRWLAVLNESRGRDSTGLFTTKSDKMGTQVLVKDAVEASKYILTNEFDDAISGSKFIIGHTRAATKGSVTKENAHPFRYDYVGVTTELDSKLYNGTSVVGAHNGWIVPELLKNQTEYFKFPKEFDVDSQLIFATLAKFGGDYKLLSQIEGAITIAFSVPNLYKDLLFLYKRKARELHMGYTPEGIYFSSQLTPLELVGAKMCHPVPDDNLVILKNGEIFDVIKLDEPKIKTIPLGTSRLGWKHAVPEKELESFPELKAKVNDYSTCDYTMSNRQIGFNYGNNSKKEDDSNPTDEIAVIINEIAPELDNTLPNYKAELDMNEVYPLEEREDNLTIIKLKSSVDKTPVEGWAIFDEIDNRIATITAINGIGALKFPVKICEYEHTLRIADPLDLSRYFTFKLTPLKGRVLEVTLILPFPQTDENKTTDATIGEDSKLRPRLCQLGEEEISLLPDPIKQIGSVFRITKDNTSRVFQPEKSLPPRQAEQKVLESEGQVEGYKPRVQSTAPLFSTGSGANITSKLVTQKTVEEINKVLSIEYATFGFKNEIKSFMNGKEYCNAKTLWNSQPQFKKVKISTLMYDAAALKFHDYYAHQALFSINLYMAAILDKPTLRKGYITPNMKLTQLEELQLEDFIDMFLNTSIRGGGTEKKSQMRVL